MLDQQQSQGYQQHPNPKDYDELMTWRIRWYLIIAITIIYTLSLVSGLISYWYTKDPRYLLFIAPTALIPFVRYLIPMDKRRYELKLAKIYADKERAELRQRVQHLEREVQGRQLSK